MRQQLWMVAKCTPFFHITNRELQETQLSFNRKRKMALFLVTTSRQKKEKDQPDQSIPY